MIAVIDYGAGNLFSVCNALSYLNIAHKVTRDAAEVNRADAVILPGVGAFPPAMQALGEVGLTGTVREMRRKSRCSASASECRCSLTAPTKWATARGSA